MNNNNPLLGQVLGGVFGQALGRRGVGGIGMGGMGGLGGGLGGALGGAAMASVLGGILGGRRGMPLGRRAGGNGHAALLMLMLPLAMRWVQSNGGINAVLDRFRQKGLARQTQSWVGTGENQPIDEKAVQNVVGGDELRQMAQRLGVPEDEVAQAFAEIMPEMVHHLTPQGQVPQQADEVLDEGRHALEREIEDVQFREVRTTS